jgi:hypothetical protein
MITKSLINDLEFGLVTNSISFNINKLLKFTLLHFKNFGKYIGVSKISFNKNWKSSKISRALIIIIPFISLFGGGLYLLNNSDMITRSIFSCFFSKSDIRHNRRIY